MFMSSRELNGNLLYVIVLCFLYVACMDSYNEIKHNLLGDMYAFEHYEGAIMSMIYIGLVSDCQMTNF